MGTSGNCFFDVKMKKYMRKQGVMKELSHS